MKICASISSSSVFHRDIKDENILVDTETLEVKLIDFGCATEFDRNRVYSSVSGTPEFFPPEVFTENVYKAEPTTVWSLGTLLHVLIYGDIPFHNTEDIVQNKISSKVKNQKRYFLNLITRLSAKTVPSWDRTSNLSINSRTR